MVASRCEDWAVFIGYARESEAKAREVFDTLAKRGVRAYFFPARDSAHDRAPDAELQVLLRERLRDSRALLIVHDCHHVSAEWCGWELETFREIHGADAPVYCVRGDHAPLFDDGIRTWSVADPAWPPKKSKGPATVEVNNSKSFWSIFGDPRAWSTARSRPAPGFRLFGRNARATLSGQPRELPGIWRSLGSFFVFQTFVFATAAYIGFQGELTGWQRQLVLVFALCSASIALLSVVVDLPAALAAGSLATIGSLSITWGAALQHESRVCDDMLAGGLAAGTLVGASAAVRFLQRPSDPPLPNLPSRVWTGVASLCASLSFLWLIFHFAAPSTFNQLLSNQLRLAVRIPSDTPTMSLGMLVGALSGVLAALVIGRARATSTRGRKRLRAAALPSIGAFAALTIAGFWSTSSEALAMPASSPAYGMNMGLLAAMVLLASFGFHAALCGWSVRTGDDALVGLISALLVLPVVRDAVPALSGASGDSNWSMLQRAYYFSLPGAALLTYVVLPKLGGLLQRAEWAGRLEESMGAHWIAFLVASGLMIFRSGPVSSPGARGASELRAPPKPTQLSGSRAPTASTTATPPRGPASEPSLQPNRRRAAVAGGPLFSTPSTVLTSDDGDWSLQVDLLFDEPQPPEPAPPNPRSPEERARELFEIYVTDQQALLPELAKASRAETAAFWQLVYAVYPERRANDLENNKKFRVAQVKPHYTRAEAAHLEALSARDQLLALELDENTARAAPEEARRLSIARADAEAAVRATEAAKAVAKRALDDAPESYRKSAFKRVLGGAKSAAGAAEQGAGKGAAALGAGDGAVREGREKLRAHRASLQDSWITARGGLVHGSAGGRHANIHVGSGMRLSLSIKIDAANRVVVVVDGCGVHRTLTASDTILFPEAPELGCPVQVTVPRSLTSPISFNLNHGNAVIGFEDGTDGDRDEPRLTLSASNAWFP